MTSPQPQQHPQTDNNSPLLLEPLLISHDAKNEEEESQTPSGVDTVTQHRGRTALVIVAVVSLALFASIEFICYVIIPIHKHQHHRHDEDNNNTHDSNTTTVLFPSRNDTLHMAALSHLVYAFHSSTESSDTICQQINERNISALAAGDDMPNNMPLPLSIPPGLECHWYHHDWWAGTQVLLVSTPDYVAVVYGGTDDVRTSLTDVNILSTPYGTTSNGSVVVELPEDDSQSASSSRSIRVHAGCE